MFDKDYISSLPKTDSEVMINGVWLTEAVPGYRTNSVSGRDSRTHNITTKEVGRRDGAFYRYKKLESVNLTINFGLFANTKAELEEAAAKLRGVLDVTEGKLSFFDEQNKYYIGTVAGITMDQDDNSGGYGYHLSGSFEFQCNNPYKYSTFENKASNNDKDTITLVNNGSAPTPLTITTKVKKDGAYLGFVLGNGITDSAYYQLGDPETSASGKKDTNDAETLFDDYAESILTGWSLNTGWPVNDTPNWNWHGPAFVQGGPFIIGEYDKQKYLYVSNFGNEPIQDGSNQEYRWYGPTLTKTIAPNKKGQYPIDWKFSYRVDFSHNDWNQVAHQSMNICDSTGKTIFSFSIEKNIEGAHWKQCVVKYNGGTSREMIYLPGNLGSLSGNWGNMVNIEKKGYIVTVSTLISDFGTTTIPFSKSFTLNTKDTPARFITFANFRFNKKYPAIWYNTLYQAKMVMYNSLSQNGRVKTSINKGDIIKINAETNECTINGVTNWNDVDIGSTNLMLKPGTHVLRIVTSAWAPIPEVEVTYRERWK